MIGDNHFVFVAPMFDASKTLPRMLHSLYGQSYDNWHLILIDDVSDHEHLAECKKIIDGFIYMGYIFADGSRKCIGLETNVVEGDLQYTASNRISFIQNTEKKWEVANVLKGISLCDDDDIICRIDADDWLTDLDALAMINSAYQQTGCDLLWTAHRWAFSDKNISGPMAEGTDPYRHPWVSSHLKTFRKRLLNGVNDENFRGPEGDYIKRAGDQAIYLPCLRNAKKRVFMPRVMYHYTIKDVPETYQTDDAHFQRDEALFLRQRGYVS